jgi:hypothetical protein
MHRRTRKATERRALVCLLSAAACSTSSTAVNDAAAPDAQADVSLDVSMEDASTPDADAGRNFSTDRGLFFGASRCSTANLQLCDGFETGSLDTTTWSYVGTHAVVDGLEAARGTKALHVTVVGNGLSLIKETKTFPEPGNTYWGRLFVYFKSLPEWLPNDAGMSYAHWTFAYATGTGITAAGQIRLSGQLAQKGGMYLNHFGVGTDDRVDEAGTGDWTNSDDDPDGSPAPVPTGSWACIEWLHSGATNETRFFWDAVEHPSLYTSASVHGGNTNPYILPQFDAVSMGWQEYQASTETFELWIDEVAIDPNRIGCVL